MCTVLSMAGIIKILEGIRSLMINDYLGTIMSAAAVIASLLAAWSFIKISHDYIEGQGVTMWMFLKPLLIVLIVCNFDLCVLKPVHILTTIFTNGLTENTEKAQDGFLTATVKAGKNTFASEINQVKAAWSDNYSTDPTSSAELDADESTDKEWWKQIKRFGAALWAVQSRISLSIRESWFAGLTVSLYGILSFLMHIVYYVQVCLCYIFLTVYGLLGPFSFAFSILPTFSRGISDWLARYIQVAFWIPVGQIVFLIGNQIMLNMANIINGDVGALGKLNESVGFFAGTLSSYNIGSWLSIILIVATMFAICSVPKICSTIIESAGAAGADSGVYRAASSTMRSMGRTATIIAK